MSRVVPCVGAVVVDSDGRLLMIQRGQLPAVGSWSVPGGRIEPGETAVAAVAREVLEETGLDVEVGRLVGTVQLAGPPGVRYEVADFACTVRGGELRAGDDARAVGWYAADDMPAPLTDGLLETLAAWGAFPR